jgi:hypothetical protein
MQARSGTLPATATKFILSYTPQAGKTQYPQIPPGLYIFIQHKTTKEVFLYASVHGHGHAFPLLHLANKLLKNEKDDEEWLGLAGEQVFGYGGELLGLCVLSGQFHSKLKLTEPSSSLVNYEEQRETYENQMKTKLAADLLPFERFFFKNEWSKLLFTSETRVLLFAGAGIFRSFKNQEQEEEIAKHLKLNEAASFPSKIATILQKLFISIQQVSMEEANKPKAKKLLSSCRSAIFHSQNKTTVQSVDFSTPPGLGRQLPDPSTSSAAANPNADSLILPLSKLNLNIASHEASDTTKKNPSLTHFPERQESEEATSFKIDDQDQDKSDKKEQHAFMLFHLTPAPTDIKTQQTPTSPKAHL